MLSCLNTVQLTGNSVLALRALALWQHRPERLPTPLIVADRSKNRLTYVPAAYTERALGALTTPALTKKTVGQILSVVQAQLSVVGGPHPEDVDADDCRDRWGAVGTFVATAAGVAYGIIKNQATGGGTSMALSNIGEGLQYAGASVAVLQGVLTFTCKEQTVTPATPTAAAVDQVIAEAAKQIEATDMTAESQVRAAAGALSQASEMGDYVVPDSNRTVSDWMNRSDPATPPPVPTSNDDNNQDANDDDQPRDEDGQAVAASDEPPAPSPTEWGTPNPDDAGETHGHPPGFNWPVPGDELPNPDDPGPGGPVSLPNGAVFIPTKTITQMTRAARMRVSATTVSSPNEALSVFELSVSATALGSGTGT